MPDIATLTERASDNAASVDNCPSLRTSNTSEQELNNSNPASAKENNLIIEFVFMVIP
jgi:hypothetical protein